MTTTIKKGSGQGFAPIESILSESKGNVGELITVPPAKEWANVQIKFKGEQDRRFASFSSEE